MITANEAYALTKINIAKKAREAYTDALNVAKHTDDRTSVAICEKVYVDVIDIVNAAVELLVALAENTRDEKAKKHAYSVLEKMERTFIDYKTADRVKKLFDAGNKEFTDFATTDVKENTQKAQTTLEDITKAYADFANANLKMLNDLAENRKFPGYTVGDFMKEVSKYRDIRWKDKGNENDILSLSDVLNLCYQIFSV